MRTLRRCLAALLLLCCCGPGAPDGGDTAAATSAGAAAPAPASIRIETRQDVVTLSTGGGGAGATVFGLFRDAAGKHAGTFDAVAELLSAHGFLFAWSTAPDVHAYLLGSANAERAPAVVLQVDFEADGSPNGANPRRLPPLFLTSPAKGERWPSLKARGQELLDFLFAEAIPPATEFPGAAPTSSAGLRAGLAVHRSTLPKLVLAYGSPTAISSKVKAEIAKVAARYREPTKLHVVYFNATATGKAADTLRESMHLKDVGKGYKVLYWAPLVDAWPKQFSVLNGVDSSSIPRWLANWISEYPKMPQKAWPKTFWKRHKKRWKGERRERWKAKKNAGKRRKLWDPHEELGNPQEEL